MPLKLEIYKEIELIIYIYIYKETKKFVFIYKYSFIYSSRNFKNKSSAIT